MKFSWKANWEILLVLVTVAVGIVITTIAAIKNRDKHYVALPDETDQFGQHHMGISPQTGGSIASGLPFNTDPSSQSNDGGGGSGASFLNPFGQQVAPGSPNNDLNLANDNHLHDQTPQSPHQNHLQHHHHNQQQQPQRARTHQLIKQQQQQTNQIHSILGHENPQGFHNGLQQMTSPLNQRPNSNNNLRQQQQHVPSSSSTQTKFDDLQDTNGPPSHNSAAMMQSDAAFDSASSTEQTPSQIRLNQLNSNSRNQQQSRFRESDHPFNTNNKMNLLMGSNGDVMDPMSNHSSLSSDNNNNLEDIHTTRSSMNQYNGNNNNNINNNNNFDHQQALDLGDHQLILLKQAGPNQLKAGPGSSVLDDPDDQLMNSQFTGVPNNNNNNNNQNNSTNQQQPFNPALINSLLNSINPSMAGSNEQPLNDMSTYHPGSSNNHRQQQQQQQQQLNSPLNQQHQNFRGGFSGSLPISMLFNDILKLARPFQQDQNQSQQQHNSNRGQNQQQTPPGGIMQQLRSLPSPFMSLLQSLAPSGSNSGRSNSAANNDQQLMNQFMMVNNDASESNQHYHKLLPSDINALLARSMRSATQPPVLPAFPAPKGFSEKRWIQGEPAESYQSSMNANADFVANNAAGFVRQQAAGSAKSDQQAAANNQPQDQGAPPPSASSASLNIGLGGNARAIAPVVVANTQSVLASSNSEPPIQSPEQSAQHQQQIWIQQQQKQPQYGPETGSPPIGANLLDGKQHSIGSSNNYQPPTYQTGPIALGAPQNHLQIHHQHLTGVPNYHNQQQQQVALGLAPSQQGVALGAEQRNYNQNQNYHHYQQLVGPMLMDGSKQKASITLAPQHQINTQPSGSVKNMELTNMNTIQVSSSSNSQAGKSRKRKRSVLQEDEEVLGNLGNPEMSYVQSSKKGHKFVGRDGAHNRRLARMAEYNDIGAYENDDDGDDPPMSVVSPDGRPMDANDGSMRRALANKYQHNLEQSDARHQHPSYPSKLAHLKSQNGQENQLETASSGLMSKLLLGTASTNDDLEDELDDDDESASEKRKEEIEDAEFGIVTKKARRRNKNNKNADGPKKKSALNSSSATSKQQREQSKKNNKKKASSSLVNQAPSQRQSQYPLLTGSVSPADEQARQEVRNSLINNDILSTSNNNKQNNNNNHNGNSQSTGEADDASATYARRQQQRSDVEFYGHPGEETRQLKYGILGSGNYEIVNGGVYAENDELTAAVNSVANYVRKPGRQLVHGSAAQTLALALPRLLKANAEAANGAVEALRLSAANAGHTPLSQQHNYNSLENQHPMSNGARDAQFNMAPVAGGRLNAAGLLRDASAVLADSERPHGHHGDAGLSGLLHGRDSTKGIASSAEEEDVRDGGRNHPGSSSLAASPLLDLIYDSHNSIDSGLLSQLGSTSRIVHDTNADSSLEDKSKSSSSSDNMINVRGTKKQQQRKSSDSDDNEHDNNQVTINDLDNENNKSTIRQDRLHLRQQQQQQSNSVDYNADNNAIANNQDEPSSASKAKTYPKSDTKDKHQNDQFNSYVISPSKKVTIFSDRDLDSAPSEHGEELVNWTTDQLDPAKHRKAIDSIREYNQGAKTMHHDHHEPYRSN